MTFKHSNSEQQHSRHYFNELLREWSVHFQLEHLSLWECLNKQRHCIWVVDSKLFKKTDTERASHFSVTENYVVTFIADKPEAFLAHLRKQRHWLPILFESALASQQYAINRTLWRELTDDLVSVFDGSFYEKLLNILIDSIPSADSGLFLLYNQRTRKLAVRSGIGFDQEYYQKIQIAPTESIAGTTFTKQELLVFNDEGALCKGMESLSPDNKRLLIQANKMSQPPHAVLSFPIINDGRTLGVVVLQGSSDKACFPHEVVTTMYHIMDYVSLLFGRYQNHRDTQKTKRELEITYRALRTEHKQLQKTLDLYNILTTLIRNNKGIKEIMRAMYEMTLTPITYYDELLLPIASCGTNNSHVLPENFLKTREARYSIRVKKWQLLKLDHENLLLIIPVVGAEKVIGFLCAWINEQTFNDSDRTLLEYSASILGLESMKRQAIDNTKRQLFGDIFEQIISNNFNETMLQQAKNLDLNEKDFYTVLVCEYGHDVSSSINEKFASEACMKWLEQAMREMSIKGLVTHRRGNIVAFLSFPSESDKRAIDQKLTRFCARMNQFPSHIKVGIGRLELGFIRINQSYNDAKQCIRLLHKKKSGKIYRFSSGGIDHLLMNHDSDELHLFVDDHLGLLLEYDVQKNKDLLHTLFVYLENNRNLQKTTEALSIHHNTLYYRISQIEQILSVKLSSTEDWMNLAMAWKIYQFLHD